MSEFTLDCVEESAKHAKYARIKYEKKLKKILSKRGYLKSTKIVDTLQGTIWRSVQKSTNKPVVIKITSKDLASECAVIVDDKKYKINECILSEKNILRMLSNDEKAPDSFVKYIDFMKSNVNFYLVMQDGGNCLFDFNVKVHEYIECGQIDICEWHKLCKIILNQMVECLEYLHSKNVCHFDISLENILINDVDVEYQEDSDKFIFCADEMQSKLCDFGLAEYFAANKTDQGEHGEAEDAKEGEFERFESNKFCGKLMYQSPEISMKKENFNAQKNDIWCLGVCLFMLITGNAPFRQSIESDKFFKCIMDEKGDITKLMKQWNKMKYVNDDLIQLFQSIFQFEDNRIDLDGLKSCKWLNN